MLLRPPAAGLVVSSHLAIRRRSDGALLPSLFASPHPLHAAFDLQFQTSCRPCGTKKLLLSRRPLPPVKSSSGDGASGKFLQLDALHFVEFLTSERVKVVSMLGLALALCNADRAVMSVAIVPLSRAHGWTQSFAGIVQVLLLCSDFLLSMKVGRLDSFDSAFGVKEAHFAPVGIDQIGYSNEPHKASYLNMKVLLMWLSSACYKGKMSLLGLLYVRDRRRKESVVFCFDPRWSDDVVVSGHVGEVAPHAAMQPSKRVGRLGREVGNILVGHVGELEAFAVWPKPLVAVKALVDSHGDGEVEVVGQGLGVCMSTKLVLFLLDMVLGLTYCKSLSFLWELMVIVSKVILAFERCRDDYWFFQIATMSEILLAHGFLCWHRVNENKLLPLEFVIFFFRKFESILGVEILAAFFNPRLRVGKSSILFKILFSGGIDAMSSFLWGYLLSPIAGGALVDYYGGKLVMAWGVALWSLATLLTPWAAETSLWSLLTMRTLLGIAEGVALPSMNNMLSRWFPQSERSRAVGIAMAGFQLGNAVGLLVSPVIMLQTGTFGPFIIFGLFGFLWVLMWVSATSSTPEKHSQISKIELDYIKNGKKEPISGTKEFTKARIIPPFRKLLSKSPTWALISANAMHSWGYFVILSWMPIYFNTVYHVDLRQAAWFSALPWVMMAILGYFAGALSDLLIQNGFSITFTRKIMQSIGFLGPGLSLLGLNATKNPSIASFWLTVAVGLNSFGHAGFLVNFQEIAPQYAGISNTAGTLAAITGTVGAGFFVERMGSFKGFLILTSFLYFISTLLWNLFATGEQINICRGHTQTLTNRSSPPSFPSSPVMQLLLGRVPVIATPVLVRNTIMAIDLMDNKEVAIGLVDSMANRVDLDSLGDTTTTEPRVQLETQGALVVQPKAVKQWASLLKDNRKVSMATSSQQF
ncbi:hypothetical protein ZIOFF_054740 [Zingiber officinale]|uniref:Major facilitator superfamily (MFS) profile domain-containing protein n=1 Tax=Zingiber officinale TaxID=94328 RepID=A0A8J5KRC9_ZINOF|nr:hypothetical protein ZIOFF_054740 [Zingiber officinale]